MANILRPITQRNYQKTQTNHKEFGYEISSSSNSWVDYRKRIAVTAYMDDTAFIETSKEGMQALLNIVNSFYNMMDIVINVKKCDLLIFNSPLSKDDNKVYLGN